MNETHCSKCGAPVVWITMKNTGAHMICEPEVKSGNGMMSLVTDDGVMLVKAKIDQKGREVHWAYCPYAADFKRKK